MYFHNLESFEDWEDHVSVLESKLKFSSSLTKAIAIVQEHHNQPRVYTKGNYNRHPIRVARILVEEMGIFEESAILTALCHDLVEWSDYDIEDLKLEFNTKVFEGVKVLTWNQQEDWSDFVDRIVNSNIDHLVAIKIADKLDNNRAIALSGSNEERVKAKNKTVNIMLPLVQKYFPEMSDTYNEVIARLK